MPSDIAIKIRRGTNSQWIAANPILAAGELGLNTDNNRLKVGNGTLGWNSLSYINIAPTDVNEATQDYIGGFLQNGTHDGIDVTYNDTLNTIALSVDRDTFIDKTTAQTITNKTLGAGSTLSANLSAATYKVTGLGTPSADTDAATKLYVDTQISNILDAAPATLNTLNELAAAINDDASYAATITTALGNKQDKVSGISDTEIGYLDGVTSAIQTQINTKAPINSPTFTGTVTFPANTSGANLTNIPNSALSNSSITINGSIVSLGGTTTIAGELPSQTLQGGKYLTTDGSVLSWAVVDALPSQSGQTGKYLTTNGSAASWSTLDLASKQDVVANVSSTEIGYLDGVTSLIQNQLDAKAVYPSQTGNSGRYLTTNGTSTSWAILDLTPVNNNLIMQIMEAY